MAVSSVPFVDLSRQYRAIQAEIHAGWDAVLGKTAYVRGFAAEQFESEFAAYLGVKRVVGCANGTDALWLALKAMNIGPGDEVIVPANTFIATAEAVAIAGAKPIFVDVDPTTYLLDVAKAESVVTAATKAIIPVHLYGQPCDQAAVAAFAQRHRLRVLDDAAQAHGATFGGKRIGSFGDITAFSFYPSKNLGAYGDAGAIATNNDELANAVQKLGDHGSKVKYEHDVIGTNSRLDGIQGATLSVKLKRLDAENADRQRIAARYAEGLKNVQDLVLPAVAAERTHVFHLYVVQVSNAKAMAARLKERGVGTGFHYPIPCHEQRAFSHLVPSYCPMASRLAPRLLSLPMFPGMTDEEVNFVIDAVKVSLRTPLPSGSSPDAPAAAPH